MERSKFEKIIMYIGISSFALAFIFYNIAPLFGNDGFDYIGIVAFGKGFASLFSFDFKNGPVLLFGSLFLISIACLLLWLIQLATKEGEKKDFIRFGITVLGILFVFGMCAGMFAAKVVFNGKEQILYDGIRRAIGNGFPKVLAMTSIGLCYLAMMSFTLLAFMNFEKYIFQEEE